MKIFIKYQSININYMSCIKAYVQLLLFMPKCLRCTRILKAAYIITEL